MAKLTTIFGIAKELAEGKTSSIPEGKNDYVLYHDSYTSAIQEAVNFASKNGYQTNDDNRFDKVGMGPGRPKNGKTVSHSLDLYKGDKKQRKALQIQVYNRGTSGTPFELNCYIR